MLVQYLWLRMSKDMKLNDSHAVFIKLLENDVTIQSKTVRSHKTIREVERTSQVSTISTITMFTHSLHSFWQSFKVLSRDETVEVNCISSHQSLITANWLPINMAQTQKIKQIYVFEMCLMTSNTRWHKSCTQ